MGGGIGMRLRLNEAGCATGAGVGGVGMSASCGGLTLWWGGTLGCAACCGFSACSERFTGRFEEALLVGAGWWPLPCAVVRGALHPAVDTGFFFSWSGFECAGVALLPWAACALACL